MTGSNKFKALLLTMSAALVLASCSGGGSEVASPGEGGFNGGSGGGDNGGGSGGGNGGTVPADCPENFTNAGLIANNTLRNCELPTLITGNLVVPLRQNTVYSINGRVRVGQDVGGDASNPIAGRQTGTLTIEPGVTLFGSAGLDYLLVNRGSRLLADGTVGQPIVFTSRQDLEGTAGADTMGQWGGVIMLGRAPISNCNATGATPGTATCERVIEGTQSDLYGGNATEDNSGRLTFVQIRFTGYALSAGNELQGLTLGGVGRGTTIHHVQSHNSADDGIEIFGGNVNLRHIVLTGNDDDSLDTDNGYNGKIQFVIATQRQTAPTDSGSRLVESSSAGTAPRSNPKIANFTFIGRSRSGDDGLVANSNTNTGFYNGIVVLPNGAPNGAVNIGGAGDGTVFHSVFLDADVAFAGSAATDGDTAAARFAEGSNNNASYTNTLTNLFVNGNQEATRPVFNITTLNGGTGGDTFFQSVNYVGAVRDSSDTWWQGWTCGLPGEETCH
ncbi:MAG TPA: hypothetical protein VD906_09640 [Caulobacteraceae bacterium]|nr:hypothetical protein [Caulobacteraceae bacterium]